jgi:hypothetical protein
VGENMRKEFFKPIVVIITLLFLSLVFQPAATTNELEIKNIKPKEYLYETIIDITDDQQIKNLFKQNRNEIIDYNINLRNAFLNIILKKPRILTSMLLNKPDLSNDYLDFAYSQGIEIINIIGEEKSIEIINSIIVTNPEILNELTNIIFSNEELAEKITTLEIMNNELKPELPFQQSPIICAIFTSLTVFCVITAVFIHDLAMYFPEGSTMYNLLTNFIDPIINIALIYAAIAEVFHCWDDWP